MSPGPETFGPYLVYEELGVGGMAKVHRAEKRGIEGFSQAVALKRMLPHIAADDAMVKSFVREARLASYLRHANVAQTYELGLVDGTYFIAMELVAGHNLREILKRCARTTWPMPIGIALGIINQLCDALDYAHNLCDDAGQPLGIIHRDVSPSNIIVTDGGVVKLIDFGIAKASAAGMQTTSGALKGKFGYMAPEYIAGSIDARADLFALGVIAYELLTNRPLFTASESIETLQRVRLMEVVPPSAKNPFVPREIDEIVMTALERDPDRRWQHATALRTAMNTVTKRCGLEVMHHHVMQWLEDLFDAPTVFDDQATTAIEPAARSWDGASESKMISIEGGDAASGSFVADDAVPTTVRAPAPIERDSEPKVAPPTPVGEPSLEGASAGPTAVTSFEPTRNTGRAVAVLLVLVAAAIAATVVYFVLPLLTT